MRGFGAENDDSLPFFFGAQMPTARVMAYLDPVALHGELGISFYGRQNCPDDCLPSGEFRAAFLMGPSFDTSDRTRLSARLGASAHVLGRGAYTVELFEVPKLELSVATWSAPHSPFPDLGDDAGIDFVDVTVSSSFLLAGGAESSGAEPTLPRAPTIGGGVLGIVGPMSLEARATVAPAERPMVFAETQACLGLYATACLGFEGVVAELVHETSPSDQLVGGAVMLTVGAGVVGAIGDNEPW